MHFLWKSYIRAIIELLGKKYYNLYMYIPFLSLNDFWRFFFNDWYSFGWRFAQPLPLNTGAPGHLADIILGISGVVYPCPTITDHFWFEDLLCSEYWARTICAYFTFWRNIAKNEVLIKNHKNFQTGSSDDAHQGNIILDHDFQVTWDHSHLSAKRSTTTVLIPDVNLGEWYIVIPAMYR